MGQQYKNLDEAQRNIVC